MLEKLAAVANRFEELCARSEQPDFYNDPKKATTILRERNDLSPSSRPTVLIGTRSRKWRMPRS